MAGGSTRNRAPLFGNLGPELPTRTESRSARNPGVLTVAGGQHRNFAATRIHAKARETGLHVGKEWLQQRRHRATNHNDIGLQQVHNMPNHTDKSSIVSSSIERAAASPIKLA